MRFLVLIAGLACFASTAHAEYKIRKAYRYVENYPKCMVYADAASDKSVGPNGINVFPGYSPKASDCNPEFYVQAPKGGPK